MTSSAVVDTELTVDPVEQAKEHLETSIVNVDNENEELLGSDRFQQRLERFGTIAPEAKKISRALRFGIPHETIDNETKKRRLERFGTLPDSTENEQEKKRQRAERFNVNSPTVTIDEETKQKRIDRFGVVTPSSAVSTKNKIDRKSLPTTEVVSDAIKKRTERFGDVSDVAKANTLDEQKAKRAERFKPITSV
ncbi:unnamed protein product [Rotaria sp. Silwood1]|nr:unnamed protein product [Rotaria sp. Silwood1]CAF3387281.1 unnamed protein product [Rotaria sp. Silwood1]CAF3411746.1 unnamed protein product [Rotaria sp. Silwood1]CAF3412184.1 unnamed protein product [Rotaria sp. Silwood1]CAF4678949.1 unnamed protein product [Rotaria sp. Silwood1]